MAYGTLEALKGVDLLEMTASVPDGKAPTTMLDQVSLITAVSGGSFTAAYYGLHGEGIFRDFRERFLLRDVQGDLTGKFLNPFNWPRIWSPMFGRSDLAQEYYDEILFSGAKLTALTQPRKPLIIIQATDVVDGIVFPFVPETFDWICSDLRQFPVSRAVAASSAFPGILSPVVLKNYAGTCNTPIPAWVSDALTAPDPASRVYHMAVRANAFLDPNKKPYVYLADGGISDNLGLRMIIDGVASRGGLRDILGASELQKLRRIAFIVVDAETQDRPAWSILGQVPGIGAVLGVSSTVMVNKYNFETTDLLRRTVREWQNEDDPNAPPLDFYLIHMTFSALPEQAERDYFHGIPTTFSLTADQVDRLRETAARLLYASHDFQRLVADMGGRIPTPQSWLQSTKSRDGLSDSP
jgi:NTE family protein